MTTDRASSTIMIAEIGQAHDGSLGMAHAYIDALKDTGVHIVKFQTHIAEAESSIYEPFRVKFSTQDATRMDYWKRMEFTEAQWKELKIHCEEEGMEFMSSPFSQAAVDLLERIGVKRYKIGSGEVNNFLMLKKIAMTGKPVILSSGMSDFKELDRAVKFIQSYGNPLAVLQCTTSYPTPPERVGLHVIGEMKKRYPGVKTGLSDHSGEIFAGLAAVSLGAEILEFHTVFDKRQFGPDTSSSLTIEQVKELVRGVRFIERARMHPVNKADNSSFAPLKAIFEKSLAVSRDIPAGTALAFEDLEAKKPAGRGIPAGDFEQVIGKRLNKDLKRYSFLTEEDIDG